MTNNFDWRTDEDGEWEGGRPEGGRARPVRRWVLPTAIILIAVVAVGAIYWQVQKRVSAAETAINDDIRSSFHLIRQAEEAGDIELFRNLLSGSDLEWAAAQQALFDQGRLFDLTAYGLSEAPRAVTDVEVTLSPSLNSAEVSAVVTYGVASGGIDSEPVRLRQTSVFRRGERWIWSPPREEFWSGKASIQEQFLAVSFPARDEALALRLARDLDLLVADLCDFVGLACPEGLMLTLNFSREPGALVAVNERFVEEGLFGSRLSGRTQGRDGLTMTLPTPSLLGTPLDETSYQALLKGFGAHIAVALADRFVDADCCGTESRFRAAERHMLGELGLDPWFGLAAAEDGGEVGGPADDQVALLCSDGYRHQQRLFLLDLSRMTWQEQVMTPELMAIKAMPDGDGLLLLGQIAEEKHVRSQVWHLSGQGPTMLFDLPVTAAQAAQIGWELQEQQALLVVEVPDLHRGYSSYFSIDLAQCGHGECPMRPQSTVSRPVWSPDGSQLMVRAYGLLWWRVGASMVPIADGSAPFWVDEERYGYVRTFGQEQAVVMVETAEDRSEQVVLTTSDLRDAVGLETRPRRLLIGRVIADQPAGAGPGGGEWLILAFEIGAEDDVNQARFFVYDLDAQEARLIPHAGRLLSFNLTPSRDKIAMGGFMEEDGRWAITVVGREIPGTTTATLAAGGTAGAVPSYSWSRDESWLLILDQGLLTLVQPQSGDIQTVRPPDASCVQAAWYGRGDGP